MKIDYYDKILAGMGSSLAAGTSAGFLTGLPMQYGVGAGAALAIGLMYHGMFMRAPIG